MDDITSFVKNEKELESLIPIIWIFSEDIRMEFGVEKCDMFIMKTGKRETTEGIKQPNKEKKLEYLEKRKTTNTWKY